MPGRSGNLTRIRVTTKHDPKVILAEHPLLAAKLSILRAKTTMPDEFRRNVHEMSILLLAEAARSWETAPIEIETPFQKCDGHMLRRPVVIIPILRAGLGMLEGMSAVLPEASVGHIGLYRDPETLRPVTYCCRLPVNLAEAEVLLVDPMLATGHSASEANSIHLSGRVSAGNRTITLGTRRRADCRRRD